MPIQDQKAKATQVLRYRDDFLTEYAGKSSTAYMLQQMGNIPGSLAQKEFTNSNPYNHEAWEPFRPFAPKVAGSILSMTGPPQSDRYQPSIGPTLREGTFGFMRIPTGPEQASMADITGSFGPVSGTFASWVLDPNYNNIADKSNANDIPGMGGVLEQDELNEQNEQKFDARSANLQTSATSGPPGLYGMAYDIANTKKAAVQKAEDEQEAALAKSQRNDAAELKHEQEHDAYNSQSPNPAAR